MKRIASLVAILLAVAVPRMLAEANPGGAGARADSSPFYDRDGDRVFDDLQARLPELGPQERIRAIVLFRDPVTDAKVAELRLEHGSFPVAATWQVIDGMSADLTASQIRAFSQRSDVIQVEPERIFRAAMDTARKWYGVDKSVTDFGVTGDRSGALKTYTSADVVACVVDTGIDSSHVDLNQGQVIGWKDFVGSRASAYDDNGHGSHVSGILAGQGDGLWSRRGVAYGTALVGVKALDASGAGSTTNIINGINFCVTSKAAYNIKIINLSLGTGGSSDGKDSVSVAVNAAFDAGILPVVAAGNDGPAASTVGSPGAASKALTVCSLADPGEGGFFISTFSSRGPTADSRVKPDVCAAGESISSVAAGSGSGYTTLSGTSMATPFVAGVVALMIDANPSLSPTDLKTKITTTAQDWTAAGADSDVGLGRIQAYEAVKSAGGFTGTAPTVPSHYVSGAQTISRSGNSDSWTFSITKTSYPIALTLIVPGATSSKDFDLYLYEKSGSSWTLRGSSETTTRQETIDFTPTATGTYEAVVLSYAGSGSYTLDSSYGGSAPVLSSNG